MNSNPPEGISEDDYEAIEAAVMETVRGRWFLAEYARRSRVDEMRQLLDAVGRLEQVVTEQKTMPADPAIRLLVQRLKEVGGQLNGIAAEMRLLGMDTDICGRIETQSRALGGLLRLNGQTAQGAGHGTPQAAAPKPQPVPQPAPQVALPSAPPLAPQSIAPMIVPPPMAAAPLLNPQPGPEPAPQLAPLAPAFAAPRPIPVATPEDQSREEIRLTALARLDCLPLAEKLALFS